MRRLPQPDPDDVEIEIVYCFGCGRRLGVAAEQKMAVYCEELCWHKEQLIALEASARNRAFNYLVTHLGHTVTAVSAAFDVTRARVNQVIAQSNGNYLSLGRKDTITDEDRATKSRAGKASANRRWSDTGK